MSAHTIHLRSETPDLLIEFELPPGTHGRIGASPASEITLPLGGIPPFSCIMGRFHDGALYLADLDGALSSRITLPAMLTIPPYQFQVFRPEEEVEAEAAAPEPVVESAPRKSNLSQKLKSVLAHFANGRTPPPPPPAQDDSA